MAGNTLWSYGARHLFYVKLVSELALQHIIF